MRQRRPAPWWFVALVAAAFALLVRAFDGSDVVTSTRADDWAPPALAFIGWLIAIGQAIWTGLQAAGQAVLTALVWSVKALWAFAVMVHNGLKALGKLLLTGAKKTLDLFRGLYREVLKPAWTKFWKFVDQVRDWAEKKFKPLFDLLFKWRKRILDFYTKWIRPILDVIGVARKVLRVLQTFGIDWARALDKKLADLERRIEEPFRRLLAEVNKIINIVNRVVTADGLFQRLALIRSVERDIAYVVNAWNNSQSKPLTDEERQAALKAGVFKTNEERIRETQVYLDTGAGPNAELIDEWSTSLALRLGVR